MKLISPWLLMAFFVAACGADAAEEDVGQVDSDTAVGETAVGEIVEPEEDTAEDAGPTVLPEHAQRMGDPAKGFEVLTTKGYVGCGIPQKLMDFAVGAGMGFPGRPLPGRDSQLPFYMTSFTTKNGVELVSPNCFTCHADVFNGELVIGLGTTTTDFGGLANEITSYESLIALLGGFVTEDELAELKKFVGRLVVVAPYLQPLTLGPSPADNLAAILFAHRDPETLQWFDEPQLEPPPTMVVPVDVPPWWRMQKKHTMFYSAAGRGDHSRLMATSSTLCVDTLEEAQEIDSWFPDVRAYLLSLEPPDWPWENDSALAAQGKAVFTEHCALCHGTYDDGGHTYPNLLIDIDVVGTDGVLAVGASQFVGRFVDWFNNSFYGEMSWLQPEMGYVPPPLDAVWATAPYLHNGSVPTLAALLESSTRPKYWRREYGNNAYDPATLGWKHTVLEQGQDAEEDAQARKLIYDTTNLGYGNMGHTFGDVLTAEERIALLEYLKTL